MNREPRARQLISATRQLNQRPGLVGAARQLRERTLGEESAAWPAAHDRPAAVVGRQLAALRRDSPGVLGELGLTALQAWQLLAERQGRGRGEIDVAIMFTDLVGFSDWALDVGDELAIRLLRDVGNGLEPPILERRGEVVKRLGDGLMAAFPDASSAAEAAFEACERVRAIEVAGYRPELRTGIHLGRPRKIARDYFGVDVNIAARLAEAAKPGEILVSTPTIQSLDAAEVSATRREFTAKGVPADLGAHTVQPVRQPVVLRAHDG